MNREFKFYPAGEGGQMTSILGQIEFLPDGPAKTHVFFGYAIIGTFRQNRAGTWHFKFADSDTPAPICRKTVRRAWDEYNFKREKNV